MSGATNKVGVADMFDSKLMMPNSPHEGAKAIPLIDGNAMVNKALDDHDT